jgi:hypothetical protein
VDGRNYRGVSFLVSYTYAHSLDTWSRSSQTSPLAADANNYGYQYGNGDRDIRHRARFSPRWQIPGISSPGQMLEGWTLSTIISVQGGFAWGPVDATGTDWAGNAQQGNANSRPNNGVWQTWNYSGPTSAFNSNAREGNTMPCYGRTSGGSGSLAGCTTLNFGVVNSDAALEATRQACIAAAQAPYAGNATMEALALRSLTNKGCYIRDGGIMTPPAYGTLGNSGRNPFRGPSYTNVDLTVSKDWHVGERYSAELRVEFFNLFNTPSFGLPGSNVTSGFNGRFGFTNTMAAQPRRMQFGLKIGF